MNGMTSQMLQKKMKRNSDPRNGVKRIGVGADGLHDAAATNS